MLVRSVFVALLVALSCQPPPELPPECAPCRTADACCAARTVNVESNCRHHETCLVFTGEERQTVIDGCVYYLRVGSTPPAPAVCGPHPAED